MIDLKLDEMTGTQLKYISGKLSRLSSPALVDNTVIEFWNSLEKHVADALTKRETPQAGNGSATVDEAMQDLRKTAKKVWECCTTHYEEQHNEITERIKLLEEQNTILNSTRLKDIVETLRIAAASVRRDIGILKQLEQLKTMVGCSDSITS